MLPLLMKGCITLPCSALDELPHVAGDEQFELGLTAFVEGLIRNAARQR
jgi:hypothetical protein